MRALVLDYSTKRLEVRDVAAPAPPAAGQVLLRVAETGVCGTDRELARFRFGYPPPDADYLVLGHEALAQVVETGSGVTGVAAGDWVVPTVRRACSPPCRLCARGRRDLCVSGNCRERGIFGAHGYFAPYAVDEAADLAPVPASLAEVAVLLEPLSVAEKAVRTALRLHPAEPGSAVVFGAGAVGLLAALVLQLRGLEVSVCSLEAEDHPRAGLVRRAGMAYRALPATPSRADLVIEAAGAPQAALAAVHALHPLGVCVILGAMQMPAGLDLSELITGNRAIAGSVNAAPEDFSSGVRDLARIPRTVLAGMMRRVRFEDAPGSILGPPGAAVKLVHAADGW